MYKHASLTGLGGPLFERNQEATVYVGNLEPRVNEEIIWELFLQVGQIMNVHIPRDKVTNEHQSYGFVEFKAEEDADYSIKILHMVKLFNKTIKVKKLIKAIGNIQQINNFFKSSHSYLRPGNMNFSALFSFWLIRFVFCAIYFVKMIGGIGVIMSFI